MLSDVFISYPKEEKAAAEAACAALEGEHIKCWMAPRDIPSGVEWPQAIVSAIGGAQVMLLIFSNHTNTSKQVPREVNIADNKNVDVIVVQIDKVPPAGALEYLISTKQWLDASKPPFEQNLHRVTASVRGLLQARIGAVAKLPDVPNGVSARAAKTVPNAVKRFLEQHARIEEAQFFRSGKLADVYFGKYGERTLAIKVFHNSMLDPSDKGQLLAEMATTSRLNHPSFLRISKALFDEHQCYIIADHVGGYKIADRVNAAKGPGVFSAERVTEVLNQLCAALVEAQKLHLRDFIITPSRVFVEEIEDQIRVRLSPISFMLFKNRVERKSASWDDELGPFTAPERWRGAHWFNDCMRRTRSKEYKGEELRLAILDKSNQFALGMLAWTMLEGGVPFRADPDFAEEPDDVKEQFFEESRSFSGRVAKAPWRTGARALARIIERMVQHDPARRWASMEQLHVLIKALAADYAANEVDDMVKAAYQIAAHGKSAFYESFYEKFFRSTDAGGSKVRKFFVGLDMAAQYRLLDDAIGQLLNFRQQQSEPTTLTKFVARHKRMGLSRPDFENFGHALIESFDAALAGVPKQQRMMAAIEIVVWPGIYYMISQCAVLDATGGPG